MKNYICIEGKQIELSEETVNNLKKQLSLNESLLYIGTGCFLKENITTKANDIIQIGNGCVSEELKGRCLIVRQGYIPEVRENKEEDQYPYIIVFKEI